MAAKYRSGHRLDLWISERAWADLVLLPQPTQRARVEAAFAQAVLGPTPKAQTSAPSAPMAMDVQRGDMLAWVKTADEDDCYANWEALKKRAGKLGLTLQR